MWLNFIWFDLVRFDLCRTVSYRVVSCRCLVSVIISSYRRIRCKRILHRIMRHIIMELYILFCIIWFYFGFMIYIIVSHQSITSFLISCCFLLHRIVSCVVSVIFRENMLLWVGSSLMVLTMMHRAHDLTAVHCLYVLLMVTCRMILSEKIRNKSLTSWDSFSSVMILVLQHSS